MIADAIPKPLEYLHFLGLEALALAVGASIATNVLVPIPQCIPQNHAGSHLGLGIRHVAVQSMA